MLDAAFALAGHLPNYAIRLLDVGADRIAAATLCAHGIAIRGYKNLDNVNARRVVLTWLEGRLDLGEHSPSLLEGADVLDAAICVAAGRDFLDGDAILPTDRETAETEGWIWCFDPRGRQ